MAYILLIRKYSQGFFFIAKLHICQVFSKINFSRNAEITLSFMIYVNHALVAIFSVTNMYFYAIHENKILAKMFWFTVTNG